MSDDPVAAFLRGLVTSDRARAAAWDAVYTVRDDAQAEQVLRSLPFSDEVRARLWHARQGGPIEPMVFEAPQPVVRHRPLAPDATGLAGVAVGLGKGGANTLIGIAEGAYRYLPGVRQLTDLVNQQTTDPEMFAVARRDMVPTTPSQRIGFAAEQLAEFLVPAGVARAPALVRAGLEAAKAGALTAAQGGTPSQAGVSAALTAAVPTAMALRRATAGALQAGAEKTMVQALGPTKEAMKAEAVRVAPEMLRRGVRGTRDAMLAKAEEGVEQVGQQIGAAIDAATQAGQTVPASVVRDAITAARAGLLVPGTQGMVVIEGAQPVMRALRGLEKFLGKLGPDIPVGHASRIKTVWDRLVSRAGLYGPKAGASATDSAQAWATREAASAFRAALAKANPTIADLNSEYAFWKGLRTVLAETTRRTQAQGGGLVSGFTGATGAAAGFAAGEDMSDRVQNAVLGGLLGRQFVRALQSPQWRTTVSGPAKQALADALASGHTDRIARAVGRIVSALPARVGQPDPAGLGP